MLLLLATGAGAGYAPRAPGTAGTLVAVPLYLALAALPLPAYVAVTACLCALAVPICGRAAVVLGSADPGAVVLDEIAGFLVAMCAVPPGWAWVIAGFCAFRFFDILKPWPIAWLDRHLRGGLGIVADDLMAGLYAAIGLQVSVYIL